MPNGPTSIFSLFLFSALAACASAPQSIDAPRCPAGVESCGPDVYDDLPVSTVENLRDILRSMSKTKSITWSSKVLNDDDITAKRVSELVDMLLDPKSALNAELMQEMTKLKGNESELWNIYFKVYDKLMPFVEGYVEIFLLANRHLPKTGHLIDYGAGSGNGTALLFELSPSRKINAVDSSSGALAVAEKKFAAVADAMKARGKINISEPWIQNVPLQELEIPPSSIDGGVMNNVLYSLPDADRLPVLKKIFADLKPGARLVLNDPRDFVQKDPAKLREFLINVITSGVENHAPLSEKEAAFIGALNLQFLIGGNHHRFLSTSELQKLARDAGFISDDSDISFTYYKASTLLVLQKPE